MTFKNYITDKLVSTGMSPEIAEEALASYMQLEEAQIMEDLWQNDPEGYPQGALDTFWSMVDNHAQKWLADNYPKTEHRDIHQAVCIAIKSDPLVIDGSPHINTSSPEQRSKNLLAWMGTDYTETNDSSRGLTVIEEVRQYFSDTYSYATITTKVKLKCWLYHSESRQRNNNPPFTFANYMAHMRETGYIEQIRLKMIDVSDIGGEDYVIDQIRTTR